jgi:hypothetical protein
VSNLVYNDQDLLVLIDANVTPNLCVDQDLTVLVTQRLVPALINLDCDQDLVILIVKRSGRVSVTGHWEDPAGNPIAGGTLSIRLNTDVSSSTDLAQVSAQAVSIILDANGSVSTSLYPNSLLSAGETTYYEMRVSTAAGQPVWSAEITVPNSTYFIGS